MALTVATSSALNGDLYECDCSNILASNFTAGRVHIEPQVGESVLR